MNPRIGGSARWLAGLIIALTILPGLCLAADSPKVAWRSFGPAAFRAAQDADRLILLVLELPWSANTARARDTVWSDEEVSRIIGDDFIAIRERADLRPDLARRFPAAGWPSVSLLLPDGSPLYLKATEIKEPHLMRVAMLPAKTMASFLFHGSRYYQSVREEAIRIAREEEESARRESLLTKGEAAKENTWSAVDRMKGAFDTETRYFGGPPRLPQFDLLELLFVLSAENENPWQTLAEASLETLYSKLLDPESGGIYRMAVGADWEQPQKERLLEVNARTLDLLTLAYRRDAHARWHKRADSLSSFLIETLGNEDGSFAGAACRECPKGRSEAVLSGANGLAASALIHAGSAFGEEKLVSRGLDAARFLLEKRYRKGRGVPRAVVGRVGVPQESLNLADQGEVAWAFLRAWEVTGDRAFLDAARDLARVTLTLLRDKKSGALRDIAATPSGPLPLRRSLYPIEANSRMVRVLVRLYYYSERKDKIFRTAARDILDAFANSYRKPTILMPSYALANYEYFFAPMSAVVVSRRGAPESDRLRQAALGSDFPFLLITSLSNEDDTEKIVEAGFAIQADAGLHSFYDGLKGRRVSDPRAVRAGLYDLRMMRVEQREAVKKARTPEAAPKIRGR